MNNMIYQVKKKEELGLKISLLNLKLKEMTTIDFIMKHRTKIMMMNIIINIMKVLVNIFILQICHH